MSRLADVLMASVLLALTFPLLVIASLAIKWDSPGPALEKVLCIGCRGRRFQLLQFRTTVHAPDEPKVALSERHITSIGAFLRYTRIDHLPRLLNVLRGDMSLVEGDGRAPSFLE